MLKPMKRFLRQKFGRPMFVDMGDYRRTVFLAGTGRSGTTWVEDVLNYDHSFRVMFEPFHSHRVDVLRNWRFRQYLRPDSQNQDYYRSAKKILSGSIRADWVDQFNRLKWARKRIVKAIRANLILAWIKQQFPEIPIILLLRHPLAVTHSKLKLAWESHLNEFLEQEDLMEDHLHPFRNLLENPRDDFDSHLLMWCVENYLPLKQFQPGEIQVVFYEHLCQGNLETIKSLLSHAGQPFTEKVLESLAKPSALSRPNSPVHQGGDLIDSWRRGISEKQMDRACEILQAFGLHHIYGKESLPRVTPLEALQILQS